MENSGFDALDGMDNKDETEKESVTYELVRRDTNNKLKRKKNKTQNHGARNQTKPITKRLHEFKMAANYQMIKIAAYKLDNDKWRENTIIIMEDIKMVFTAENRQEYKYCKILDNNTRQYLYILLYCYDKYKLHKMKDTNWDDF